MALGTLTIDLAANVAGLESDLGRAQRVFDKNARDFQRTAAGIAKLTAGISAAVSVGFAAMVKSSLDTADSLTDVSESSGIAVEKLSALKLATDIEGIALEQVSASLNKFSKTVDDAADGAGAGADSFKALGINVMGVDGALKDNYTLIGEVAEALSMMENGAQKTALAQELFGKSGVKLLPILNGGRQGLQEFSKEAERMGLIISTSTAESAGVFNDNLTRLRLSLTGLSTVVAGEVADDLADFTNLLSDPKTQEGIANLSKGIVGFMGWVAEAAVKVSQLTTALAEFIAKWKNGIDTSNLNDVQEEIKDIRLALESPVKAWFSFFDVPERILKMSNDELKKELVRLSAVEKELQQQLQNTVAAAGASVTNKAGSVTRGKVFIPEIDTSGIDEKIQKLQGQINSAFESQRDNYARQIALTGEVTELERVRYETSLGSLRDLDAQQKIILENQAKEIDQINLAAKAEADRKAVETKLVADLEAVRTTLLTQEEALREAAEERFKILEAGFIAGKISEEEFSKQSQKSSEMLNKQLEDLKKQTSEINEFTKNLYRGVQNSIADALVNGIKGGGENALEAFRDLLIRMAAEAAAADLTKWLFGGGQGSGAAAGSSSAGWINAAIGLFGGGRAVGGPVQAGRMYEVGENNNPELFRANGRNYMIPGNGGSVIPAAGGGGNVVTINMSGISNAREAREAAGAVARKVSAAVSAGQRYS